MIIKYFRSQVNATLLIKVYFESGPVTTFKRPNWRIIYFETLPQVPIKGFFV